MIALLIVLATTLSGCSWLGKGKEVSDAYSNTENAASAAFTASVSVTESRKIGRPARTETETASGAYDYRDPARPRARSESTVDGKRFAVVQPGNGRIYFDNNGEVASEKLPKDRKLVDSMTMSKVLNAFASAFVNFRDAPPLTSAVGAAVPAIAADIGRVKACGKSLRQALRALLDSSTNEKARIRVTKKETRGLSRECNKALPTPPSVTFGIENGFLTNFVLDLDVRESAKTVAVRIQIQLSGIGQPQTEFDVPKSSKRGRVATQQDLDDRAARSIDRLLAR